MWACVFFKWSWEAHHSAVLSRWVRLVKGRHTHTRAHADYCWCQEQAFTVALMTPFTAALPLLRTQHIIKVVPDQPHKGDSPKQLTGCTSCKYSVFRPTGCKITAVFCFWQVPWMSLNVPYRTHFYVCTFLLWLQKSVLAWLIIQETKDLQHI